MTCQLSQAFDKLALVPEEQITDKIRRRIVSGTQGTRIVGQYPYLIARRQL